ncbi:hypothetical protein [Streptacidiphilus sp. PAMC 29251]
MTDPEIPTIEQLRDLADARVREQVQAAQQRSAKQAETRATFAARRNAGVRTRNTAKAVRLGLIQFHDSKESTTMTETAKTMSPLDFTTLTPDSELLCRICLRQPATLAVSFTKRINGDLTDKDLYACTSCAEHHAYAFTTDLMVFEAALARYVDTNDTKWVDERADGLEVARQAYGRMRLSCEPLLIALEFSRGEIEAAKASMTGFVTGTEMTTVRTSL